MPGKRKKKGVFLPPTVGYSFKILLELCRKNQISPRYYLRVVIITLINLINLPFRVYERWRINPVVAKKEFNGTPVFILGHWRSGTTLLHNLLCQDERFGYVTTYQSVFPDTLHSKTGRFIFGLFTKLLIPGTRKGDNVELNAAFPQEEEFALGDKTPLCFYYFWMFPRQIRFYYNQAVRFQGVDKTLIDQWKNDYILLIKKALKNTNQECFLSKNPPNTARIRVLLEMFPNAKFIHIHRNPVEVFLSTRNFYYKMMPHLQLQTIAREEVDAHIFDIYKKLMNDFLEQKELIPPQNLVEIAFSDLEKEPEKNLEAIYKNFDLGGFDEALPNFQRHLEHVESYEKNKHNINAAVLAKIADEWGFMMKKYNYSVPENIEIVND